MILFYFLNTKMSWNGLNNFDLGDEWLQTNGSTSWQKLFIKHKVQLPSNPKKRCLGHITLLNFFLEDMSNHWFTPINRKHSMTLKPTLFVLLVKQMPIYLGKWLKIGFPGSNFCRSPEKVIYMKSFWSMSSYIGIWPACANCKCIWSSFFFFSLSTEYGPHQS